MENFVVQFVVSGAGGALLVALFSGSRSVLSQRAPRNRIRAIKEAQETLDSLPSEHEGRDVIMRHQSREISGLERSLTRHQAAPRVWTLVGLFAGLAIVAVGLVTLAFAFASSGGASSIRSWLTGGITGAAVAIIYLISALVVRLVRNARADRRAAAAE